MLEKLIADTQDLFSPDIYSLILMPLLSARLQDSGVQRTDPNGAVRRTTLIRPQIFKTKI